MSDIAPGPGTTSSRVRLPIDDVVDRVYGLIEQFPSQTLALLAVQTPYVVSGVLGKYRMKGKA